MNEEFKNRVWKCYLLAGRYVISHPRSTLVHGTINGNRWGINKDNPHAWVEIGDEVFDPVLDQRLPKNAYAEIFCAKAIQKYTAEEAAINSTRCWNWGPWSSPAPAAGRQSPRRPV